MATNADSNAHFLTFSTHLEPHFSRNGAHHFDDVKILLSEAISVRTRFGESEVFQTAYQIDEMPEVTVTELSSEDEELFKRSVSDEITLRDLATQVLGDSEGTTCALSLDGIMFPRQSSQLNALSEGAADLTLLALVKDARC